MKAEAVCELCTPQDVLFESPLAYVRLDNHSLSRGHVLVVPSRYPLWEGARLEDNGLVPGPGAPLRPTERWA